LRGVVRFTGDKVLLPSSGRNGISRGRARPGSPALICAERTRQRRRFESSECADRAAQVPEATCRCCHRTASCWRRGREQGGRRDRHAPARGPRRGRRVPIPSRWRSARGPSPRSGSRAPSCRAGPDWRARSAMSETPHHIAQGGSGSVRTSEPLSCPVCRAVSLRGRQSVCSPRCRAKRHRQRREDRRQAQIQDVRVLLHAALTKLEGAL
jgi:hypothetical protein